MAETFAWPDYCSHWARTVLNSAVSSKSSDREPANKEHHVKTQRGQGINLKMNQDHIEIIPSGGCVDCGGRCVIKLHVKNGVVIRVTSDDGEEPQLRACLRGRAYRNRVYDPNRLKHPLRRTGARGEGKFERVSWDEALDTVAAEIIKVKETYGPMAVFAHGGTGNPGLFHGPWQFMRMMKAFGAHTTIWGGPSAEASVFASRSVYGTLSTGHTRDDLVNSRLIIMWGWNPATTVFGTNTSYYLARAREAGARIICIDPRFTNSAAVFSHQWIPVRPGSDTAMMAAMAHVMVKENLQDKQFLETYTVGFDKFKDYVMGVEDNQPKTPAWAASITGVPAEIIEKLAREYAATKPAALIPGFAPGRTAYGEEYHRMAATLAAMTGNIGIHGGGAAGFDRGPLGPMFPSRPLKPGDLDIPKRLQTKIHSARIWDAIIEGKAGGYPSDIKLMYIVSGNPLNQYLNTNKGIRALNKLESIIVHEQFMTATARFADILLPANTIWERNDIARPWLSGPYFIYMNKAIETMYESKSDYEIFCEVATRLGLSDFGNWTEEEGLRDIVESSQDMSEDIPDYEEFKRTGVFKYNVTEPQLSFKKQREDFANNPFPTPSGKIEIYSEQIAELNNRNLPPIPKYIEPWESIHDPLAKKYPLQLITIHFRTRAHSNFDNIPWLKELETQTIWINADDAGSRGIGDGDEVKVFNDRGEIILPARVTERIMPGVVAMGEGAWYSPDENGIDRGGCCNVLSRDEYSPGGGWPTNTGLVQVSPHSKH
ncbi:molybdopterin-dependent oxidoreductase [Thermodesulfobacteriota bacterium]